MVHWLPQSRHSPVPSTASAEAGRDASPRPEAGAGRRREFSLGRLSGLDGLRAIAVIAVLLYHDGRLSGGFLGVDVFFVISGFLITALLLNEWRATGHIDVKRFWLRRARRLLPALFLLLGAVLLFVVAFVPDEVARLRTDVVAAFGYVTNWYLILANQSYFEEIGRPSPLRHLWSLAVEEQFYLFWPLVLSAGLLLLRKRLTLVAVGVVTALSIAWMAYLYVPFADPSRVYYGTDTRVFALLIGAGLAFIWIDRPRWQNVEGKRDSWRDRMPSERVIADVVAITALAVVFAFFALTDDSSPFLYMGGFALLAIATAFLIAGVVHPAGHLGPLILDLAPMRWLGERSYSLYLWHWPVYMFTRPEVDVPIRGWENSVLRLGLSILLAEISYRFVENPIRHGAIGAIWRNWRALPSRDRRGARRVLAPMGLVLLVAIIGFGAQVALASPPPVPDYLQQQSIDLVGGYPVTHPNPGAASSHRPGTPTATRTRTPTAVPTPIPGVGGSGAPAAPSLALGDSVMLGAAHQLVADIPGLEVDAAISRHWFQGINIVTQRAAAGDLPHVVIIDLGNNDHIYGRDFDAMMRAIGPGRVALFVTLRLPRDYEVANNATLADGVSRWSNAYLSDWFGASDTHPEYFYADGMHLQPSGRAAFAALIAQSFAAVASH